MIKNYCYLNNDINVLKQCCGCSACAQNCPTHCITMEKNFEGFLYPVVDMNRCSKCNLCEYVCPFIRKERIRESQPRVFACKLKNDLIRENSSSGGIFSAFADYIISKGGCVYGAAMYENMKGVHHVKVFSSDDMYLLRGSKYMQSDINNCFIDVKADLESENFVLFSGTPCQVNALKLFLYNDYEKLFCIEVLCHGVPSPLVWKKYAEYIESKYNSILKSVNFRCKKNGWNNFGIMLRGNCYHIYEASENNPYLKIFLRNYSLRESCYDCQSKKTESMADISIGDFWGVESILTDFADSKGVSLAFLQSEKGKNLFSIIKNKKEIKAEEVTFNEAIRFNSPYYRSVTRPQERDYFFEDLKKYSFAYIIEKYGKNTLKESIAYTLKRGANSLKRRLTKTSAQGGGGWTLFKITGSCLGQK